MFPFAWGESSEGAGRISTPGFKSVLFKIDFEIQSKQPSQSLAGDSSRGAGWGSGGMAIRCLTTQQPHPQPRIRREFSQEVGSLAIYLVPLHPIVQLQLLVLGWYHPLLPPCNLYPSFPLAGRAGGLISPANLFSPPLKAPGHEDIPLPGDSVLRLLDTDPPWGSLWLCSSQAALSNVTPWGLLMSWPGFHSHGRGC